MPIGRPPPSPERGKPRQVQHGTFRGPGCTSAHAAGASSAILLFRFTDDPDEPPQRRPRPALCRRRVGHGFPFPEVGDGPRRSAHVHRRARWAGRAGAGSARRARAPPARHARPAAGFLAIAGWGGVAFFIAAWLQQAGIVTATVTNTGFLTALYVVITPFIAWGWSGTAGRARSCGRRRRCRRSAPGCSEAARSARSRRATCWWRCRPSFWAAHVVITGSAARFAPPDRLHRHPVRGRRRAGRRRRGAARDVTLDGLAKARRRHRLRRSALERAHVHAADGRPAAHAALGGGRHRQPGDRIRGAGGLPGAGRAARARSAGLGAALIMLAMLLVQLGRPGLARRTPPRA